MLLLCILLSAIVGICTYTAIIATEILHAVRELRAMADHPAGKQLDPRW